MYKTLKRIAIALEAIVEIENKRNKLIEEDMTNERKFKNNYLEIMDETSNKLVKKIGE